MTTTRPTKKAVLAILRIMAKQLRCQFLELEIYGAYSGFEPLDDFCMPNAGCTGIKYNGEWL